MAFGNWYDKATPECIGYSIAMPREIKRIIRVLIIRIISKCFQDLQLCLAYHYSEWHEAITIWRNFSYLRVLLINVLIELGVYWDG